MSEIESESERSLFCACVDLRQKWEGTGNKAGTDRKGGPRMGGKERGEVGLKGEIGK